MKKYKREKNLLNEARTCVDRFKDNKRSSIVNIISQSILLAMIGAIFLKSLILPSTWLIAGVTLINLSGEIIWLFSSYKKYKRGKEYLENISRELSSTGKGYKLSKEDLMDFKLVDAKTKIGKKYPGGNVYVNEDKWLAIIEERRRREVKLENGDRFYVDCDGYSYRVSDLKYEDEEQNKDKLSKDNENSFIKRFMG